MWRIDRVGRVAKGSVVFKKIAPGNCEATCHTKA